MRIGIDDTLFLNENNNVVVAFPRKSSSRRGERGTCISIVLFAKDFCCHASSCICPHWSHKSQRLETVIIIMIWWLGRGEEHWMIVFVMIIGVQSQVLWRDSNWEEKVREATSVLEEQFYENTRHSTSTQAEAKTNRLKVIYIIRLLHISVNLPHFCCYRIIACGTGWDASMFTTPAFAPSSHCISE